MLILHITLPCERYPRWKSILSLSLSDHILYLVFHADTIWSSSLEHLKKSAAKYSALMSAVSLSISDTLHDVVASF